MAKITDRASWQILEDVNKLINNAKLIYENELPANFETLKTRYKEAMAKKETLAKSIRTQQQANDTLSIVQNSSNETLAELDELFNPSKSSAASKRASTSGLFAKWDIMDGHQHHEPRTLPVLKRAIKSLEETLRQYSNKIETLQIEHKTIEDDFKVSIDNLKDELVKLVGSNSAPDLRRILEPVARKQEILKLEQKALARASAESLFSKWDYMDGHRPGGRIKKRKSIKRNQIRQTKRRQTKRR